MFDDVPRQPQRAPAGFDGWLSVRHSLGVEAAVVVAAVRHPTSWRGASSSATPGKRPSRRPSSLRLERSLHLFVEAKVQHAADVLPGLTGLLGVAYLTLHSAVTAGVLLWLHQRRPSLSLRSHHAAVASALALVGFLAYPTAPPRLAGIGIADTVSNGHVDLNTGLVSSLYNPYAAVPSMHIGYALIVGDQPAPLRRRPARTRARDALPGVRAGRGRRHR